MVREFMRSPLANAQGFGSAGDGVNHWWRERVTAVALIPLTLWLCGSLIAHTGDDHAAFAAWLKSPINTTLMTLLVMALFWHTALGLQVVIEDYVHSAIKIPALIAMRLACFALAASGVLSTMRIAFGG